MLADKITLPPAPPAPVEGPYRRLLGKKFAINVASLTTGLIAAGTAYAALAMIVGMGLGVGILYQAESMRLATGIQPASFDLVPPIGSAASIMLAAVALSVPVGAFVCGRVAYRSTRRWLTARFGQEG